MNLTYNPTFPLGLWILWAYQKWINKNLMQAQYLMTTRGSKSFAQLQQEKELLHNELFQYLQIKHFLKTNVCCPECPRMLTSFESVCFRPTCSWYDLIHLHTTHDTGHTALAHLYPGMVIWLRTWVGYLWLDLNLWIQQIMFYQFLSVETNDKILTRWYLVPSRVALYNSRCLPSYFRNHE